MLKRPFQDFGATLAQGSRLEMFNFQGFSRHVMSFNVPFSVLPGFSSSQSVAKRQSFQSYQPANEGRHGQVGQCGYSSMGFVLLTMIPVRVTPRMRRTRLRAQKADTSELEQSDLTTSATWFMEEKILRDLGGVGVFIASIALPGWHVFPVFLDLKLANDPALPGLTAETLPITTTAIFLGWLASAAVLDRFLEVWDKKQLLLLHVTRLVNISCFSFKCFRSLTSSKVCRFKKAWKNRWTY